MQMPVIIVAQVAWRRPMERSAHTHSGFNERVVDRPFRSLGHRQIGDGGRRTRYHPRRSRSVFGGEAREQTSTKT